MKANSLFFNKSDIKNNDSVKEEEKGKQIMKKGSSVKEIKG